MTFVGTTRVRIGTTSAYNNCPENLLFGIFFFFLQIDKGLNETYMLHLEAAYQFADIVLCVFSFFSPSISTEACNSAYTC